jgi:hypothetical protein
VEEHRGPRENRLPLIEDEMTSNEWMANVEFDHLKQRVLGRVMEEPPEQESRLFQFQFSKKVESLGVNETSNLPGRIVPYFSYYNHLKKIFP